MKREYFLLNNGDAQLHFSRYGKGKKVLLTFHGFGLTHASYSSIEKEFAEQYTIYSFDLFYHGSSFWHHRDRPLTKERWSLLISKFFDEHKIDRFTLMGFSMGAKFCLATLELFPERIEKVILIAPDGIKTSFWYNIATYPSFFRRIFRRIVTRPFIYFLMVNTLRRLKLIDKGLVRFANTQMKTRKQRRQVFYSWVVFRELRFEHAKLVSIINRHNIDITLFLGKYDKIIRWENLKSFFSGVKGAEVEVLQAGHSNLVSAVAEYYHKKK